MGETNICQYSYFSSGGKEWHFLCFCTLSRTTRQSVGSGNALPCPSKGLFRFGQKMTQATSLFAYFSSKSLMYYTSQLLEKQGFCARPSRQACCKGSHCPAWIPDPESSGSQSQLPRGADGHLTPPQSGHKAENCHQPPSSLPYGHLAATAATSEASTSPAPKP